MHYVDTNKMHGEKAWWELHKNATCCLEQILEATAYKTAAVRLPTSHLTKYSSKTNRTYEALPEKQVKKLIGNVLL